MSDPTCIHAGNYGEWLVWQWAIETGQDVYGYTVPASTIEADGFDSKDEALKWAARQDQSYWGNWGAIQFGENVVVKCDFAERPKSYKVAYAMSAAQGLLSRQVDA